MAIESFPPVSCPQLFSLVLDEDVSELNALKFPELYRELQKRRYLSIKTFLVWTWKAVYQVGCATYIYIYIYIYACKY